MIKKEILVVEDDFDIRESIAIFLESEGYDVVLAANGSQALEILSTKVQLPSAILLDLMMPILDGFGFCREKEKDPRVAHIPVILMTADAHAEAAQLKTGAKALVKKPVDIDDLSLLLKSLP